jgi:hypothetical protein
VAQVAVERGCGRLEWAVLDWNAPAIGFYVKQGADVLPDWRICRVTVRRCGRSARPRLGGERRGERAPVSLGEFTAATNAYLVFEDGRAPLSCCSGGPTTTPPTGPVGSTIGNDGFDKAKTYFDGTAGPVESQGGQKFRSRGDAARARVSRSFSDSNGFRRYSTAARPTLRATSSSTAEMTTTGTSAYAGRPAQRAAELPTVHGRAW